MKRITLLLIIAAIMLSLLPLPVYATTATIGYTSIGANHASIGNRIDLGNFSVTPAHSGIATSMTAYVSSHLGTNQYIKYALYDASRNWIANTIQGNISTSSPQWITLNFSTPVYITVGTPYLIAVWGSYTATSPPDYAEIYYDTVSDGDSIYSTRTYVMGNGNWPTSISPYSQSSKRLSLYLTYTESATPTITIPATKPPTGISTTSATLWSYLTNDGNEPCRVRFVYSGDGGGTWGNTTWSSYQWHTGNYPYTLLTGLTGNTTYSYYAEAQNSQGVVNSGVPHSFITYTTINPPTNFTAIAQENEASIKLNWVIGNGSTTTVIMWKVGSYPTLITDGQQLCNSTFSSYTHTGLTAGDTIYYSAWGVSGTGNSTTYATDYATVSLGSDETTFTNPDLPTNWFIEVDYTKMSGVPFYGVINEVTDSFGINKQFMWGALGFMIGLMVFIASYRATQGNALSALLATTVILGVETGMGLMAGFMCFLFVIMSISLAFVHARA